MGIIAGILGFTNIASLSATKGVAAVVAGLSTTVGTHTTAIAVINNTIRYMSTNLLTDTENYTNFYKI